MNLVGMVNHRRLRLTMGLLDKISNFFIPVECLAGPGEIDKLAILSTKAGRFSA
jgi:hypothetical protein